MHNPYRILAAAVVTATIGFAAAPASAEPARGAGDSRQMAHYDRERGPSMRGGPHGAAQRMSRFDGHRGGPGGMPHVRGPMSGGFGMMAIVGRFDADGDGAITRDEVAAVSAERLRAFDADGDGSLSLDEYRALWMDTMDRQIVRSFQFHDPDGDAQVGLDEYTGSFDRMFTRFDRDRDGTVVVDRFALPPGDRPGTAPPAAVPEDGGPEGETPDNG